MRKPIIRVLAFAALAALGWPQATASAKSVHSQGKGKSALASETAAYAKARGAVAVWGTCWEGDGAPGYWPWIQAVRALGTGQHGNELVLAELTGGKVHIAHCSAAASVDAVRRGKARGVRVSAEATPHCHTRC